MHDSSDGELSERGWGEVRPRLLSDQTHAAGPGEAERAWFDWVDGRSGNQRRAPGSEAEFLIQGHLTFESVEAFEAAMASDGAEIMADIPNYTDIQPRIQVNKVVAQQAG